MQVEDRSSAVLVPEILRFILPGVRVISYALRSYQPLSKLEYQHSTTSSYTKKYLWIQMTEQSIHRMWKSATDGRRTPFRVTAATNDCIRTVLRVRSGKQQIKRCRLDARNIYCHPQKTTD